MTSETKARTANGTLVICGTGGSHFKAGQISDTIIDSDGYEMYEVAVSLDTTKEDQTTEFVHVHVISDSEMLGIGWRLSGPHDPRIVALYKNRS